MRRSWKREDEGLVGGRVGRSGWVEAAQAVASGGLGPERADGAMSGAVVRRNAFFLQPTKMTLLDERGRENLGERWKEVAQGWRWKTMRDERRRLHMNKAEGGR